MTSCFYAVILGWWLVGRNIRAMFLLCLVLCISGKDAVFGIMNQYCVR